jgi:hypothetical protein
MIFSRDLLFIHVPKTGGMSTSGYLLDVLPKPVYLSHPAEVWNDDLPARDVVQLVGRRHESLPEARDVVARHGFAVDRFPLILATIRNPYDLEVSRYTYLRIGYHWERGPEQSLALASTFEEYAVKNEQRGGLWQTEELTIHDAAALGDGTPPDYPNELKDFYTLDGRIPPNMRVIRFENMVPELIDALRSIGIEGRETDVPWVNKSHRDDFRAYYTPRAEEAVYQRYRWVFDQGFYPRLDPAHLPTSAEAATPADREDEHELLRIDPRDGVAESVAS